MVKITVYSWERGFNKVAFTKFLLNNSNLTLAKAKDKVDEILDGRIVTLQLIDDFNLEELSKARISYSLSN